MILTRQPNRLLNHNQMDRIQEILNYWFGGLDDKKPIDKNSPVVKRWFTKSAKTDQEIRDKFERDFLKARQGEYKQWEESVRGRLALIVLFDQFSRNMYRDSPRMFETDSLALDLTLRSIKDKKDRELQLIERIFLYMPLMHAEQLDMQKLSLKQFAFLVEESKTANPGNISYYEYTFGYAQRHHDIIEQFGRFPHRNEILKRSSTEQEKEFLEKTSSRF